MYMIILFSIINGLLLVDFKLLKGLFYEKFILKVFLIQTGVFLLGVSYGLILFYCLRVPFSYFNVFLSYSLIIISSTLLNSLYNRGYLREQGKMKIGLIILAVAFIAFILILSPFHDFVKSQEVPEIGKVSEQPFNESIVNVSSMSSEYTYYNGQIYSFAEYVKPNNSDLYFTSFSYPNSKTGKDISPNTDSTYMDDTSAIEFVKNEIKLQNWKVSENLQFYNVLGYDTWVVPVLDSKNQLKKIYLIKAKIEGRTVFGAGDSIEEAAESYKIALDISNYKSENEKAKKITVTGRIKRISQIVENGESYNLVILANKVNGHPMLDKIYKISPKQFPFTSVLQEWDSIKITYEDVEGVVKPVTNMSITEFR